MEFLKDLDMEENLKKDNTILKVLLENFSVFDISGTVGRANNIELELFIKPGIKPFPTKNIRITGDKYDFLKKTIKDWL